MTTDRLINVPAGRQGSINADSYDMSDRHRLNSRMSQGAVGKKSAAFCRARKASEQVQTKGLAAEVEVEWERSIQLQVEQAFCRARACRKEACEGSGPLLLAEAL